MRKNNFIIFIFSLLDKFWKLLILNVMQYSFFYKLCHSLKSFKNRLGKKSLLNVWIQLKNDRILKCNPSRSSLKYNPIFTIFNPCSPRKDSSLLRKTFTIVKVSNVTFLLFLKQFKYLNHLTHEFNVKMTLHVNHYNTSWIFLFVFI